MINLGGGLVRRQVHDDVGPPRDLGDGAYEEAGVARALGVLGAFTEADADVDAGIFEVEGVRVALRAVADDGDFFCLDKGEVSVCVVVGLYHCFFVLLQVGVSPGVCFEE